MSIGVGPGQLSFRRFGESYQSTGTVVGAITSNVSHMIAKLCLCISL